MMTHFNYIGVRRFVTSSFWSIHKVSVYNFLYGFMLRRKTFKLKRRKFTLVRLDKRKKIKKTAKGKTKIFVLFGVRDLIYVFSTMQTGKWMIFQQPDEVKNHEFFYFLCIHKYIK